MGLSKRRRNRNTAPQIESIDLILTLQRAARWSVWLEDMQKHLQTTAAALKTNPSSIIALFQKTLSRPSYFLARAGSGHWTIMLGPKPTAALPDSPVAHPGEAT